MAFLDLPVLCGSVTRLRLLHKTIIRNRPLNQIYCLPGTMCNEKLWQLMVPRLEGITLQHTVLPLEDNIEAILMALCDIFPMEPFDLLGFSMGGYLATAFAIKYPERVRRLMVVSNIGTGLIDSERKQRIQALDWVKRRGYNGLPRKKAETMLGQYNRKKESLIQLMQDMDRDLGEKVFIQQLVSTLDRPCLLNEVKALTCPVSYCIGSEDKLIPEEEVESIADCLNCTLDVVPECGHMLPIEQPLWLAQKIKDFFD